MLVKIYFFSFCPKSVHCVHLLRLELVEADFGLHLGVHLV
jgi:hypothetical protein